VSTYHLASRVKLYVSSRRIIGEAFFVDPLHSSRTAEYMAFFRALETIRPAKLRLFSDPLARHFLRPSLARALSASRLPLLRNLVRAYADYRLPGARTSAIARTRLIDDFLRDALRSGASQLVLLGAGFDSRSFRLPELQSVPIFEVDHPQTLSAKLSAISQIPARLPENVRFVALNFDRQSLSEALSAAGFQSSRSAVFLWEGVTNYLAAKSVDDVLRFVASTAPGTRLIFTYVDAGLLDGSIHFRGGRRLISDVQAIGEPWIFGIHPSQLSQLLNDRGLCLDFDLSAVEYRARYFGREAKSMRGYEFYHVAAASVPGKGGGDC
jgi:methyltransferase (TIGR00027 family)